MTKDEMRDYTREMGKTIKELEEKIEAINPEALRVYKDSSREWEGRDFNKYLSRNFVIWVTTKAKDWEFKAILKDTVKMNMASVEKYLTTLKEILEGLTVEAEERLVDLVETVATTMEAEHEAITVDKFSWMGDKNLTINNGERVVEVYFESESDSKYDVTVYNLDEDYHKGEGRALTDETFKIPEGVENIMKKFFCEYYFQEVG